MLRRSLASMSLCLALGAGCATSAATASSPPPLVGSNDPEVDCEEESSTGSHMVQQACRTQAQQKEDQRKAQELLNRQRGSAASAGGK